MSTKIETLELEIVSNSKSATAGLDALTSSLTKLKNATNGGLGLSKVSQEVSGLSKAMDKVYTANKKGAGSFTDLFHKLKLGANIISGVGRTLWSAVKASSDYTENVHLFNVAMGEYADEAMVYAETVRDAMGIDPSEWIRNQGVFMTLATGFGIAGDRASQMSQQLTQLGYDLASFYNLDLEDAMLKVQSGFAGELEPLRRIGYDLSQAKLEATALELGITKAVSSMTQAEKAQLRYYAIMTQVTETHGDMAATLDAPANQLRVLKSEVSMAAREIGNLFIPALNAILPYAIAATRVIASLASSIAGLFGQQKSGMSETTDKVVENTDSLTTNLENAKDEAKKLKSYLLGIDELNVINPNSGSTDDLSGQLDFDIPTYDFLEGLVESKVSIIVDEMKEWLGITDDIKSWSDLLDTRLGDILETVGLIGAGIASWKVTKGFIDAITALKALLSNPYYAITIGVIMTLTGFKLEFDGISDAVKNGLDGFNFAEIVGGGLLSTSGAALLGSKIAAWITTAFEGSAVAKAIVAAGVKLGGLSAAATGAALAAGVVAIIVGIPMFIMGIYDAWAEGLDWLNGTLTSLGSTLVGAGIGFLVYGPVGALIGAAIGLAVGLLSDFTAWLWQNFEEVEAWFNKLPTWGKALLVTFVMIATGGVPPLITSVVTLIKKWEDVKAFLSTFANWFYSNVVSPIVTFFAPIFEAVGSVATLVFTKIAEIVVGVSAAVASILLKVREIFLKIVEIFVALGSAAYTYIIKPIVDFVVEIATIIYENAIKPIMEFFARVGAWVHEHIISPIVNAIMWLRDKAIEIFKKVGTAVVEFVSNAFKSVINGVLNQIENKINTFIRLLNGAISIINEIPGVSITKVEMLSIPRLAEGGFPEQGQMFIAREAGAEMVGNIGRRTAVANNDQIVAGIAGGVASANEEQNTLLREQNSLLRAILEKDSGVYLDGKHLTNSVEKYQRERGRVLITGGVV